MRKGTILRMVYLKGKSLPCTEKVLDIGCHEGHILNFINCKEKIGIDLDQSAILKALKIYPNNSFFVMNASQTTFSDNYFDLILCLDVLEHVNDPELLLKEVSRIMKKDGRFIVSTPTKRSFLPLITDYLHKRWGHLTNGFEIYELRKLLHHAGFEIESVDYFWFFIAKIGYLIRFMPSKLFTKICEIDNRFNIGKGFEQVVIARKIS